MHTSPRFARALVTSSLLAPLFLVASATDVPAAADTASTMLIGTYNIRAGVSTGTFQDAVEALMPKVKVAGLQEVNSHAKEAVLQSLSPGWGYFRAPYKHGEQTPVIWDMSAFSFLSARSARIAKATYIGNELTGRDGHLPAYFATVVHLRQLASGQNISIVNIHLVPGAVYAGEPMPGRPRLFKLYLHEVARVAEITMVEEGFGPVYVLGDFNVGWHADMVHHRVGLPYRTFKSMAMRSMWATGAASRPKTLGTHSTSLIDQVYAATAATTASVKSGIRFSDHYPAVASYEVPVT